LTGAVSSGALAAGDLAIAGYAISATVSDGISYENSSASAIAKANSINASSSLTNVSATVVETTVTKTITATGAIVAAGDLLINGVDIGALSATTSATLRAEQLVAAINAVSSQTGVIAENTAAAMTLTAADGRNITLTTATSVPTGLTGIVSTGGGETTYGSIELTSLTGETTIEITGTSDGLTAIASDLSADLTAGSGALSMTEETVTGQTVSAVDISSQSGAQSALSILDSAIDTVTNSRANLGAYQNRFEAAISNLETTSTNLQASRSRILDTDYAKETTNLAKAQIVQQAATAMLAQANQSSQSVLALLK